MMQTNNKEDVLELIDKHHEQVLKVGNFSSMRINWEEKVKNIKSIAEELNIGTESIGFIECKNQKPNQRHGNEIYFGCRK